MAKMIIRKASKRDFERLRDLRKEFYLAQISYDPFASPAWASYGMPQLLARELKSNNIIYFIAKNKNKIIGYAGNEVKKLPAWYKAKKKGHLFNLYVKKEFRNKGIGKNLIEKSLSWFRKKNVSFVEVLAYDKNKIAQEMYNKMGFKPYMNIANKRLQ